MDVDVLYAKTNLSKLIRKAEAGEEVIITRRGQKVVKLSPVSNPEPEFGTLQGKVSSIDRSLLFAMSDEDADEFVDGHWG